MIAIMETYLRISNIALFVLIKIYEVNSTICYIYQLYIQYSIIWLYYYNILLYIFNYSC